MMADELLAGDRMLAVGEPLKLVFANFADEAPAVRELSVPDAANLIVFRVVVLSRVLEFLGVVAPRLARAQGFGDREHQPLLEKRLLRDGQGRRPLLGDERLWHWRLDDWRGGPHDGCPLPWSAAPHP